VWYVEKKGKMNLRHQRDLATGRSQKKRGVGEKEIKHQQRGEGKKYREGNKVLMAFDIVGCAAIVCYVKLIDRQNQEKKRSNGLILAFAGEKRKKRWACGVVTTRTGKSSSMSPPIPLREGRWGRGDFQT